ncbi:MAG: C40 family peptidase [Actinomyces sp.]|nr:C40 family peptidase [Actinomyces sp.]MDN6429026.1 C40 family peptidase [Propionibacterium sp.]MDN6566528.1 C40 family peptidase [Actinomyces sp.]
MTTVKTAPRHRKARRPLAPVTDTLTSINLGPVRGTAVISVTGLALTAAVTAAANAAPVALSDAAQQSPTAKISTLPTTVTVPDIAWTASDEIAASAEAPAPEPEPEPVVTATATAAPATETAGTQAASRSESRQALEAPASAAGSSIASIALSMLGIPYVWGGSSMAGADCSGFVQMVYAQAGISLPRTSQAQEAGGTIVPASQAQPGDILSWGYHVGIYIGDGMMVDSSTPGTSTAVRSIWGSPVYVRY